MDKKTILNVRSSAAEFLIFSMQEEADIIEVLYQDDMPGTLQSDCRRWMD